MEDERLAQIEKAKLEAINQSNNTFNQMNQDNQTMLDQNINYAEQFEKTQNETLDKQLDFYKQNIDKQKQDAQKNYETEALRAENDFVSYTNPYGYQAEMMASKGQLQSGISQTTQLGGYNAYQNRLATANKAMQDAFTQYDLDMNEAIINNDVQKAQNALAKLEMILGYQQNFYDTKNQIAQSQLSNNQALDESYYGRYMDMINQINTEKQREEAIRQFEAQLAYQKERDKVADAQWEKEYKLAKGKASSGSSGSSGSSVQVKSGSGSKQQEVTETTVNPYTGGIHKDAKNGTFSNGYQPNNVDGKPLTESSYKVKDMFTNAVGSTGISLANQKIWQTSNGNYYIWDGTINDYIDVTNNVKSILYMRDKTGDKKATHKWVV